jgi:hypothetical protein
MMKELMVDNNKKNRNKIEKKKKTKKKERWKKRERRCRTAV